MKSSQHKAIWRRFTPPRSPKKLAYIINTKFGRTREGSGRGNNEINRGLYNYVLFKQNQCKLFKQALQNSTVMQPILVIWRHTMR